MAVTTRIMAAAYALAIVFAGLAQHCDWMFATGKAQAAVVHHGGDSHRGHHMPAKPAEPDCAAMALAKAVGNVPHSFGVAAPDIVTLHALPAEPVLLAGPVRALATHPRGPPRGGGGFAAVYASNHRLLI